MSFSTFRISKVKQAGALLGLTAEHDRIANMRDKAEAEGRFTASEINWDKTKDNVVLERSYEYRPWANSAWEWEKDFIESHSVKARKDAVIAHDSVYVISPDWAEGKTKGEIVKKFQSDLEWHKRHFGMVIDAVIHFDEKTPHMHVISVPAYANAKGEIKLSAKHFCDGPKALAELQDRFYKEVAQVQGFDEPEHRQPGERKKHKTAQEHEIEQKAEELKGLAQEIARELEKLEKAHVLDRGKTIFGHKDTATVTADYWKVEDLHRDVKRLLEELEKAPEASYRALARERHYQSQSASLDFAKRELEAEKVKLEERFRECVKDEALKLLRSVQRTQIEQIKDDIISRHGLSKELTDELCNLFEPATNLSIDLDLGHETR